MTIRTTLLAQLVVVVSISGLLLPKYWLLGSWVATKPAKPLTNEDEDELLSEPGAFQAMDTHIHEIPQKKPLKKPLQHTNNSQLNIII